MKWDIEFPARGSFTMRMSESAVEASQKRFSLKCLMIPKSRKKRTGAINMSEGAEKTALRE